jgi:hypothetical protein
MAREAGFETMLRKGKILGFDCDNDYTEQLKDFEALVRADEREACAKVCNALQDCGPENGCCPTYWDAALAKAEAAIRARGNK